MKLTNTQLNQLSLIALNAVKDAGHTIQQVDRSQLKINFKNCGSSRSSQVVTEVDLHCQSIIIKQLQPSCDRYDLALLSEENCAETAINDHARFSKDYFWCIDPLDGTLPFIEGREGYAVSIALVAKSGLPVLSAIYLPATKTSYHTEIDKQGKPVVYKNGTLFNPPTLKRPTNIHVYFDQSFLTSAQYQPLVKQLEKSAELTIVSGHGAVVNALLVVENSPAIYIKLPKKQQGGGALWDFSGTACIAQAVDGWVSDIEGLPLTLNQTDSYYMHQHGVIYASDKNLAQAVIRLCRLMQ
ncbi:3'(2'),5'-bisphosphate nucleotidase CysQ family protein [Psychromonas hadalis]|uniref:3'(2'),5'-bisphosphate nucleotidase CysQ family protein n=1 Tax=Psychromonas hadalis TaxID=211669 RepID=UPI0003B75ECD|nr:inositol monophosphatase family protein [Psychromonas hadalis]